ncbi:ComF family protein [Acidipila sp. EB88]|nr:ComF family protein [Acidipila sp. EB88]
MAPPPAHTAPTRLTLSSWRAVARFPRSPHTFPRTFFSIAHSLAAALLPAACVLCETPLATLGRVPVCASCWHSLPAQSGTLCLQCGEALGAHAFSTSDRAPGDWLCRPCRVSPPAFDRAVAHGLYGGTLRSLLHLLKYEHMEPVAQPLGRLMAAQLAVLPGLPKRLTVVPVPLFRAKRRERGFNQAELLARAVARFGHAHGLALSVDTAILRRVRATVSQSGLTPRRRRKNVQAAFAVAGAATGVKPLHGKCILLVDDIYTTGATARAAALALRRAGAAEIWVTTAARAQRHELAEPVAATPTPMEDDVAFWT